MKKTVWITKKSFILNLPKISKSDSKLSIYYHRRQNQIQPYSINLGLKTNTTKQVI